MGRCGWLGFRDDLVGLVVASRQESDQQHDDGDDGKDDRAEQPEWSTILETWSEQRDGLLAEQREAGSKDAEGDLADDYRLLDLADLASLKVTCPWPQRVERHGFTVEGADDGLRLAPFPLAGATRFEIPCRWIPDRPYTGDQDLAVELACATWESLTVRVAPLELDDAESV